MNYRIARETGRRNKPWGGRIRSLRFARPSSTGGIFHGRFGAFAVLHGSYTDLINSQERRLDNS